MAVKLRTLPIKVSLSTTTARSAVLVDDAKYLVSCDVDAVIIQGGSAVNAVLATGVQIYAKHEYEIRADADALYIAGILAADTGTLQIVLME